MEKKFFIKTVTLISAFYGVALSLFTARAEGYDNALCRLLYFTAQSNLFLGAVKIMELYSLRRPKSYRLQRAACTLSFISTVSITVTGLTFCFLLAPFAPADYAPWSACNLFTHVITPLLGVYDFLFCTPRIPLRKGSVFLSVLPPLFYLIFSAALTRLGISFGRGENFPYFFLNFQSPAGFWGFSNERPYYMGSGYWAALFALFALLLGKLFSFLYQARTPKICKGRKRSYE